MKKRNSKKIFLISLLIAAAGVMGTVAAYTGYIYKSAENWSNLVYPGVTVENTDLGGKTKEEALDLLKSKYGDAILKKKVSIKVNQHTYSIDYSKLNARYNIEEVANEAFNFGKNESLFSKYRLIKDASGHQYKLTFTFDNKFVDEVVAQVEKDVNTDPVDAKLKMLSSGDFKIVPDEKGYKLKTDELKKQIVNGINGSVVSDTISISAPVDTVTATLTADKLSSINTKVASYTTVYSSSSAERKNNIDLATKAISGKVIMPGETFSFNETVGERTRDRGYEAAHVIVNNKIEDGLGGGICQVSGTLYNAILRMNIMSKERSHHTFPSAYLPKGTDATVDWGNLDYKFVNTLNYPIYIEGVANDSTLTFNIYSNSSLNSNKYDIESDVVAVTQPTVKTIQDPTLPEGQQVWDQQAYSGYKVNVYKITMQGGKVIKRELLYTDNYKTINGVLRVGTKKKS